VSCEGVLPFEVGAGWSKGIEGPYNGISECSLYHLTDRVPLENINGWGRKFGETNSLSFVISIISYVFSPDITQFLTSSHLVQFDAPHSCKHLDLV